jgi:hypothetical protein
VLADSQAPGDAPDRSDVESCWTAILDETLTREDAHRWASSWLGGAVPWPEDPMVVYGLTYLRGFDVVLCDPDELNVTRHGQPGVYLRTLTDIGRELERWRTECAATAPPASRRAG